MNVAIYGRKVSTKQDINDVSELIRCIQKEGWAPILEQNLKKELYKKTRLFGDLDTFSSFHDFSSGIDLAISLGGDGTFIKTVSYIRDSGVPILGINTGRLGFLANIGREQMEQAFEAVRNGSHKIQYRSLLQLETEKRLFGEHNFAINELTVQRKNTASMVTVHAHLNGDFLNSYWADGLIVATSAGSTAYNLSCGGPIITPGSRVHILTPIAAHNLNVRPMIVPDNLPITLKVEGRDKHNLVSLDSKTMSVANGEELLIKKADFRINVVQFEYNTFFETIRNKLLWGIDKRN